jgi:hypothetical protein
MNEPTQEQRKVVDRLFSLLALAVPTRLERKHAENCRSGAASTFPCELMWCNCGYFEKELAAVQELAGTSKRMTDPANPNAPWTEYPHLMWREQCRVGDVAFQHLFCISKGKPLPAEN